MCGIAGFLSSNPLHEANAQSILKFMNERQRHRGPDGEGIWIDRKVQTGLAHVRLSIIDLATGQQPMQAKSGNIITYNGEIYNFIELRQELGEANFETTSDTEVILRAYEKWGENCVDKLRGMFAFAIWDNKKEKLFIARDRFGIKPFYYTLQNGVFYFASEIKTLTPFLPEIKTSKQGLGDYLTFQFCLNERTLFEDIHELKPAYCGYVERNGQTNLRRYWEVHYNLDWNHTEKYFVEKVRERLQNSVDAHLRSDVEVGAYVSGGVDSTLVAALARDLRPSGRFQAFNGRFVDHKGFDESHYARSLTDQREMLLHVQDITAQDFVENVGNVIYHLDQPTAGPGSFPQYMISKLVREHIKVVLGGQGGDEIFGGYTRYLIAYFEQCIKGAIDGTMGNGRFIVSYESIIPNLQNLRSYKPLLQEFWSGGIFDSRDRRYFKLIDRAPQLEGVINWECVNGYDSFEGFKEIYWGSNVQKESYFDSMTHFDFKTLLPALLQVEDRMSMAHGVESRVPFLDHELVELAATIPADSKFKAGELKRLLRVGFSDKIPNMVLDRTDKMGFPVPLKNWLSDGSGVREFILDTLRSQKARNRHYLNSSFDIEELTKSEREFGRNIWALLSLELWQNRFHDDHVKFRG